MSSEENKKSMGDYFRNIIGTMEVNLISLEVEKKRYGRFMNFVRGINRNIRIRKMQIKEYNDILYRYIKEGRAV